MAEQLRAGPGRRGRARASARCRWRGTRSRSRPRPPATRCRRPSSTSTASELRKLAGDRRRRADRERVPDVPDRARAPRPATGSRCSARTSPRTSWARSGSASWRSGWPPSAARRRARRGCSRRCSPRWPTTASPRPRSSRRLTYLSAPDSVQGALAAGLLGGGSRFLGVTEDSGRFLHDALPVRELPDRRRRLGRARPGDRARAAGGRAVRPRPRPPRPQGRRPAHPAADADRRGGGLPRPAPAALRRDRPGAPAGARAHAAAQRRGVCGAALADLGLPLPLLRGFALLARTAGLIGQLAEELRHPVANDIFLSVTCTTAPCAPDALDPGDLMRAALIETSRLTCGERASAPSRPEVRARCWSPCPRRRSSRSTACVPRAPPTSGCPSTPYVPGVQGVGLGRWRDRRTW